MYITTLGTSHGDATPTRFNSSTLYESGDKMYMVDCGEPADALLVRLGKSSTKLDAIFITHAHRDHLNGIFNIIGTAIKYPEPNRCMHIYVPEAAVIDGIRAWFTCLHEKDPTQSEQVMFHVIEPGLFYDDGHLRVKAIPTEHMKWACGGKCDTRSYAFQMESEEKKVLHTGDLTDSFADFPSEAQTEHFDMCVCEATHYNMTKAMPKLESAKFDRLLFIHIANQWHGPMGEATLLKQCSKLPYPVAIAHDTDRIML